MGVKGHCEGIALVQGDGFDMVEDLGFRCGFGFLEESCGAGKHGYVDVCEGAGGKEPFSKYWVANGDDLADFEDEVGVYLENCVLVKCVSFLCPDHHHPPSEIFQIAAPDGDAVYASSNKACATFIKTLRSMSSRTLALIASSHNRSPCSLRNCFRTSLFPGTGRLYNAGASPGRPRTA